MSDSLKSQSSSGTEMPHMEHRGGTSTPDWPISFSCSFFIFFVSDDLEISGGATKGKRHERSGDKDEDQCKTMILAPARSLETEEGEKEGNKGLLRFHKLGTLFP